MTEYPSWIGKTLGGRYRIDEILGQGGMSAVYKAYDPNLRRIVAVKLIHPHLADDPRFLTRFEEEAAAVAQLRHPNIVQVYDFNHDGNLYYMVQEFIPGETLQERIRRLGKSGRQLAISEGVGYILNIAEAAGYAHRRGMVHRDIKPANIMLDIQNQAILMDFGIVKITGGISHTATGAMVGTALYLAPENIRGEIADARSDVYALGVVLFEILDGKPPFESDSAISLMMMHLNDPVPDLHQLRPDIPSELVEVVGKALEKDRQNRYQSMEEMATAIRAALSEGPADVPAGKTLVDSPPEPVVVAAASEKVDPLEQKARMPLPGAVDVSEQENKKYEGTEGLDKAVVFATSQQDGLKQEEENNASYSVQAARTGLVQPDQNGSMVNVSGLESSPGVIPTQTSSQEGRKSNRMLIWIGGAGIVLVIILVAALLISRLGSGGGTPPSSIAENITPETATQEVVGILPVEDTPTATATATATFTPEPTATFTPEPTATLSLPPTATFPSGVPFSYITGISIDDRSRYVVEYDTLQFEEVLPGEHVHFFFNTVPPEQAGNPGKGPWILYGGPRPFTRYAPKDRPTNAFKMCVLVANPNHSVQADSGNCFFLPDVNAVTILKDTACYAGADQAFPAVANLLRGDEMLVNGLSQDELWWNVRNPAVNQAEPCWVPTNLTYFHGDLTTVAMVESPPKPESLFVEITGITIDAQNRYVVEFLTRGYEPAIPGTHIHFFFNTFSADQVGIDGGGNRLMHGQPSPFTGYNTTERPDGADQLCALVAQADHNVVSGSGNCFPLP